MVSISWITYRTHLEAELVRILHQREDVEESIDRLKPIEKKWQQLVSFDRRRYDCAMELREIVGRIKPVDRMILTLVEMQENTPSGMIILRLKGKAKDRETFAELTEELLVSRDRYRLRPPLLEPTKGDETFGFSFSMELELSPAKGTKTNRESSAG